MDMNRTESSRSRTPPTKPPEGQLFVARFGSEGMADDGRIAVLGGAVAGLATAQGFLAADADYDVTVFERQTYDAKRVDCGEAINDAPLIPLEKTPENGFVNDVEGFELRVYDGLDRPAGTGPIGQSVLTCEPGYITERATVERRWAEELAEAGVTFETGRSLTPGEYWDVVEGYDAVVDATGQPALSLKARDRTRAYTGDMVALNATVDGDFSNYHRVPRIYFEGYVGYAWSFPKSETRANVGIGWAGDQRPDDYMAALEAAADRVGFPAPSRDQVNIYTIPKGPSLDPALTGFPEDDVYLVGDAAGVANRYQGEGICQGIRSAALLVDLFTDGRAAEYPQRLYRQLRDEFRLAHLMRGAWVEHEDPRLLAAVAESLDGLSIDEITRSPGAVVRRLLRHPRVTAQLLANRGMLERVYEAYTDRWEYTTHPATA